MPPKISPPLSPQQLLAQCRWPAAPHQLPARLAPTHQDAGSPALLSLLPPWLPAPYANCGPGVGDGACRLPSLTSLKQLKEPGTNNY